MGKLSWHQGSNSWRDLGLSVRKNALQQALRSSARIDLMTRSRKSAGGWKQSLSTCDLRGTMLFWTLRPEGQQRSRCSRLSDREGLMHCVRNGRSLVQTSVQGDSRGAAGGSPSGI